MTLRGVTRSLNARLARPEQHIPRRQGPIVYQVLFHDGTPVWPDENDDVLTRLAEPPNIVYRIRSWEQLAS